MGIHPRRRGRMFRQISKMMGLPYPGGSHLEKLAQNCTDLAAAKRKIPVLYSDERQQRNRIVFRSKTAMPSFGQRRPHSTNAGRPRRLVPICSGGDLGLPLRTNHEEIQGTLSSKNDPALIVCGGVSANKTIHATLESCAAQNDFTVMAPRWNIAPIMARWLLGRALSFKKQAAYLLINQSPPTLAFRRIKGLRNMTKSQSSERGMGHSPAQCYATAGHDVDLWTRLQDHADEMIEQGRNDRYLPDIDLHNNINISTDLTEITWPNWFLNVTPAQYLRDSLRQLARFYATTSRLSSAPKALKSKATAFSRLLRTKKCPKAK